METFLRPATRHDLDDILTLVTRAYRPYVARMGREPGPMLDDYVGRIASGEASVLETDDDRIVGLLVLVDEADALLLDNIAVDPRAQGQGLGKILMAQAESEARRRGYRCIRLYTHETMTENQAIYAKAGYRETHRAVEHGLRRVYMEKTLGLRAV